MKDSAFYLPLIAFTTDACATDDACRDLGTIRWINGTLYSGMDGLAVSLNSENKHCIKMSPDPMESYAGGCGNANEYGVCEFQCEEGSHLKGNGSCCLISSEQIGSNLSS